MRLSVRHTTRHDFHRPRRNLVQSLRLTPATFEGQRVINWAVTVEGGTPGAAFLDGAGDWVTSMTVQGPIDTVEVVVEGEVETADTSGVLRGHRETIDPRAYRVSTRFVAPTPEIRDLAADASADAPLDLAHQLSNAVRDAVDYVPGTTDAATIAAEALAGGKGVCQDHAHLLIAAAHCRGLAARYVAGYLFATGSEDTGTADGGEASHAWAEIHIPALGWVGFDASNRCCPDDRYIRLGTGRDAVHAAPIRGLSLGEPGEALDVAVSVVSQTQSQ